MNANGHKMAQALQIFPCPLLSFSGMGDEGRKERLGEKKSTTQETIQITAQKMNDLVRKQSRLCEEKLVLADHGTLGQ
jgi:hypothetical protein